MRTGSDRRLPSDLQPTVEMRDAELLDTASLTSAFNGSDVVVHTAAIVDIDMDLHRQTNDVNVIGVNNVLEACIDTGVSKLIHVSSVHAFNPLRGINLNREAPLAFEARVPYIRTKATAHAAVLHAMTDGRIGGSIICPAGLIGPKDDRPSILGRMLIDFANEQVPMLIRAGFWWTDVRDVAAAIANAISVETNGNVYFPGGRYANLNQLTQYCSNALGKDVSRPTVPYLAAVAGLPFIRAYAAFRNVSPLYTRESLNLIRDCPSDIDLSGAIEDLDYNPRPVEEAVDAAITWFSNSGMLS